MICCANMAQMDGAILFLFRIIELVERFWNECKCYATEVDDAQNMLRGILRQDLHISGIHILNSLVVFDQRKEESLFDKNIIQECWSDMHITL